MSANSRTAMPAWRLAIWGGILTALIMPWLLMRATGQGHWTAFDFIVWGLMLAVLGGGIELALRLSAHWSYRIAAAITLGGGFLMVWANLAVGIIGNEENPRNLLFHGVLLLGLLGAAATRFEARGLSRVLRAMAVLQVAVAVVAAALGWALLPVFTLVFTGLWLVAGELFQRAAAPSDAG